MFWVDSCMDPKAGHYSKANENQILAVDMWFWRRVMIKLEGEISTSQGRSLEKVVSLKARYFGHALHGSGSLPCCLNHWRKSRRKKKRRQLEESVVWQHQGMDRIYIYTTRPKDSDSTGQKQMEGFNKKIMQQWLPITDRGSQVGTWSLFYTWWFYNLWSLLHEHAGSIMQAGVTTMLWCYSKC